MEIAYNTKAKIENLCLFKKFSFCTETYISQPRPDILPSRLGIMSLEIDTYVLNEHEEIPIGKMMYFMLHRIMWRRDALFNDMSPMEENNFLFISFWMAIAIFQIYDFEKRYI